MCVLSDYVLRETCYAGNLLGNMQRNTACMVRQFLSNEFRCETSGCAIPKLSGTDRKTEHPEHPPKPQTYDTHKTKDKSLHHSSSLKPFHDVTID